MNLSKLFASILFFGVSGFSSGAHAEEFCQRFYKLDEGTVADFQITHFQIELKRIPREVEEIVIGASLIPVNETTHQFFNTTATETQICVQGHFSTAGGGRSFYVYSARVK